MSPKKRRRKKPSVDLLILIACDLAFSLLCLILALIFPSINFLLLVVGGFNLFFGIGLMAYVTFAYDEFYVGFNWFSLMLAPRTAASMLVLLFGLAQLFIYFRR